MGLFDGLMGGLFSLGATAMENSANKKMQKRAHAFSAQQSQITRDFNERMFGEAQDYNSAEAVAQRDWEEEMRKTQYTTAVGDMQRAGLNPMLAYQQGGAGTPSSSAASVSPASGGGSPSGTTTRVASYGPALQSALSVAQTQAQIKNIDADTAVKDMQADNVAAMTMRETASAANLNQATKKLEEEILKVQAEVKLLDEKSLNAAQERDLIFSRDLLARAQTALTTEQLGTPKAYRLLLEAQERVNSVRAVNEGLETPKKRNAARAEGSWLKQEISPYLDDFQKIGGSSASAIKGLKDGQWIMRSWGR